MSYTVFKLDVGWIGILASLRGLVAITFPCSSGDEAYEHLGEKAKNAKREAKGLGDITNRLKCYYQGYRIEFPDRLDLSGVTVFQRLVYETTRTIPYGEHRSYGWIASQIQKPDAVRAVGQALGKNPLVIIIPCHRVIGSDGSLRGFRGGLEMKKYLLKLEASADK